MKEMSHSRKKIDPEEVKRRVMLGGIYEGLPNSKRKAFQQEVKEDHDNLMVWARIAKRFGDDPIRLNRILQIELPFSIIERISSPDYLDGEVDEFLKIIPEKASVRDCAQFLKEMKFGPDVQMPLIEEDKATVDIQTASEEDHEYVKFKQMMARFYSEWQQSA